VARQLKTTPLVLRRPLPSFPETQEDAAVRYARELTWLAAGGDGQLSGACVVVVTHGEVRGRGFVRQRCVYLHITWVRNMDRETECEARRYQLCCLPSCGNVLT
jgi:hypothetical protein